MSTNISYNNLDKPLLEQLFKEYFVQLTDVGLTVDEIAPNMMLTLSVGTSYFLEIKGYWVHVTGDSVWAVEM